MNIKDLHRTDKPVSTVPLFHNLEGNVIALQIMKGDQLKEHTTPVPALLLCISGNVLFEDELGMKGHLVPGDYINIAVDIKHKVSGIENSQLILIK